MGALADDYHVGGVIVGGHVGYNWQFGQTVFGLEADIDGSGVRGSRAYDNFSNTRVYEMRGDISMQNNCKVRFVLAWAWRKTTGSSM